MTKTLFLLPPSEWKKPESKYKKEYLSFSFSKPNDIANNVTQKDLKCKWDRFLEGLELNKNIEKSETIEAIERYSWVMYNSIAYKNMNEAWKKFFEDNFLILSWMYWILKPFDKIWNYKLPIETKWLYDFWWTKILEEINNLKPDFVVNLLPISYTKLIFWKSKKQENIFNEKRNFKIININFLKPDSKKVSHWVKKIKGEWIKNICERELTNYKDFRWKIVENWRDFDVNIIVGK
jgi:cytoplasmic iron level regulating protein YaaA (DUF328/UPF0246 family)